MERDKATNKMGDYGEYINQYGLCPSWALSLGYGGVAAGAVLSNWGSAVSWISSCVVDCALSALDVVMLVHLILGM